jgi:hypothetical protein
MQQDIHKLSHRLDHDAKWKLDHDGAQGAAEDNQGSGRLQHLWQLDALEHQAYPESSKREG